MNSLIVFLALVGALSLAFSLMTLIAAFFERPRRVRIDHSHRSQRHDW